MCVYVKVSLGEFRIRLERLTSETTRRSRAPHIPDGTSVLRTVYRSPGEGQNEPPAVTPTLQINGHPGFLTRSPAKLPQYSRLMPLEPYLAQVDLAALHDGWSREETATHLALALEGPALQVLIDLSPEERRDLQAHTAALNRRFGQRTSAEQRREELTDQRRPEGESVGAFAADIRVYAQIQVQVQIRPLLSLRRTGALCQGLPCSEPLAPDSVTAGKRPQSEAVRGPSPRSLSPLHQDCPIVGRCGLARGLYLDCVVGGQPCSALVNTGPPFAVRNGQSSSGRRPQPIPNCSLSRVKGQ